MAARFGAAGEPVVAGVVSRACSPTGRAPTVGRRGGF